MFIAKLFAYGFDDKALRFIYDYLRHRKQRTRIGDSYSSWQEILYGVPQGSILGPLLFSADLCDLFITMNRYDIVNYADDNTPYVSGRNMEEVVASLEELSEVIFQRFRDKKILMNAFFNSQSGYCPLNWIFHSRKLNKINKLHERCLRIVYNSNASTYEELRF